MEATIDRNLDKALSHSESISQTQHRAQVEVGSDEFLDLISGLKNQLKAATKELEELNSLLIYTYNKNSQGVLELMSKFDYLLSYVETVAEGLSEGIVPDCVGVMTVKNFKAEIGQLDETLTDIRKKQNKPKKALQALFDQL